AVHVRGVEVGDPAVQRVLDEGHRGGVVGRAVHAGERHAAEPEGGDLERALTERSLFHGEEGYYDASMSATLLRLHRWIGLAIGPVVVLFALSGPALGVREALETALEGGARPSAQRDPRHRSPRSWRSPARPSPARSRAAC